MINQIKPKLVIAKNNEEFQQFITKYKVNQEDYVLLGDAPLTVLTGPDGFYGVVLVGDYKKSKHYPYMKELIQDKKFSIVQYIPR